MPRPLPLLSDMVKRLLLSLLLLALPSLAHCQQVSSIGDMAAYVDSLNSQCPINYDDEWGVNSFTMVGDRYALVDVKLPANLSMFLSRLGSNTDNVKKMWVGQLKQFGDPWNRFVDRMVEAGCNIVINLRPEGSDKTALLTFCPADFKQQ